MGVHDKNYDKEQKRLLCIEKVEQLKVYIKNYTQADNTAQLKCSYVCVNSTMFRGCLHPSPVIDLIVGNIKRGRKLKGDIFNDKLSFRYLFDENDRLMRIENIYLGKKTYVEDLIYTENTRIGITTFDGRIHSICEEIFKDGRIVSVAIMLCSDVGREEPACNLHWEKYAYDEKGLYFCDFVTNYNHGYVPFSYSQYIFNVQDGLFKSYTNGGGRQYNVTKKRDAQGKGYYFP